MKRKSVQRGFRYSKQPIILGVLIALTLSLVLPAAAQKSSANVYYPPSSIERPQDLGKFAHTNYVIHTTNGAKPVGTPTPDSTAEETPDVTGCASSD